MCVFVGVYVLLLREEMTEVMADRITWRLALGARWTGTLFVSPGCLASIWKPLDAVSLFTQILQILKENRLGSRENSRGKKITAYKDCQRLTLIYDQKSHFF